MKQISVSVYFPKKMKERVEAKVLKKVGRATFVRPRYLPSSGLGRGHLFVSPFVVLLKNTHIGSKQQTVCSMKHQLGMQGVGVGTAVGGGPFSSGGGLGFSSGGGGPSSGGGPDCRT